jgi:hypothetical protein
MCHSEPLSYQAMADASHLERSIREVTAIFRDKYTVRSGLLSLI